MSVVQRVNCLPPANSYGKIKMLPEKKSHDYFVRRLTVRKAREQETIKRCTKKERKKEKLTVGETRHQKKVRDIYKKEIKEKEREK